MPTGIYERTPARREQQIKNLVNFKKGEIPYRNKILMKERIKKVDQFHAKLDIHCKIHGYHKKWRLHSGSNVQCQLCGSDNQRKQRTLNPLKFLLKHAQSHCRKNNREISITIEDLHELLKKQNNRCALTGIEFNNDILPSLDRIDSNLGYIKDNIQLLLIKINIMKQTYSQKEFIKLCGLVYSYAQGK